jgi:hypothetical protein
VQHAAMGYARIPAAVGREPEALAAFEDVPRLEMVRADQQGALPVEGDTHPVSSLSLEKSRIGCGPTVLLRVILSDNTPQTYRRYLETKNGAVRAVSTDKKTGRPLAAGHDTQALSWTRLSGTR